MNSYLISTWRNRMPRKPHPKAETVSTPGQLSAWPRLNRQQDKAQSLVARPEFQVFLEDLRSHKQANLERMPRTKDPQTRDELAGAIAAIDFVLSLPDAVENWKAQ
jgi:hypothetical protein